MLPRVGIEPWQPLILRQHYPFYTKLTFACKTEILGSLYNHALFKYQVVHEQMFKDLLSSTYQISVERIVLDLGSEAAWVLFPLRVTFCHWIFLFSCSKDENANIGIFV